MVKIFREKWRNVFIIAEEEDKFFDEEYENEVKERLVPMIHRTVPFTNIDEPRFNESSPRMERPRARMRSQEKW